MKIIKNIDEKVKPFQDDLPEDVANKLPSFRQLFKAGLGMAVRSDGEKAIDLYQIGLKFKLDQPDIELENAEFNTLKEVCNSNPAQWLSHYHAQIMLKIREADAPISPA